MDPRDAAATVYRLPEGILHDHGERIAVLESRANRAEVEAEKFRTMVETKLDLILATQNKMRGTMGGIALVFTSVIAIAEVCRDWIFAHIK